MSAHDIHAHAGHDTHHEEGPHSTFSGYMVGFVLSVILTVIPFWLVMSHVVTDRNTAVLVLGGLGSVPGAIAGGLLMGLAEALVPSEASGWRDALAFAILFLVLLLRPSGLLGRRTVDKV